jgi:DivIVA domain-containing protein
MSIERPSFATTLVRTGYDTAEVDAAVDRVMAALAQPAPGISAGEVEALKFSPVSYRRDYDMENVDDWFDDVIDELRLRTGGAALPAAAAPATPAYEPAQPGAVVPVESEWTRLVVVLVTVAVLAALLYVSFA